jgi:hypothetical protein
MAARQRAAEFQRVAEMQRAAEMQVCRIASSLHSAFKGMPICAARLCNKHRAAKVQLAAKQGCAGGVLSRGKLHVRAMLAACADYGPVPGWVVASRPPCHVLTWC